MIGEFTWDRLLLYTCVVGLGWVIIWVWWCVFVVFSLCGVIVSVMLFVDLFINWYLWFCF